MIEQFLRHGSEAKQNGIPATLYLVVRHLWAQHMDQCAPPKVFFQFST